jgi:hypothetical protein
MSKKPITHKKNGTGGVFQDVGPEFKPMHAFSFQSPQFGILFIYLLAVRVFELRVLAMPPALFAFIVIFQNRASCLGPRPSWTAVLPPE